MCVVVSVIVVVGSLVVVPVVVVSPAKSECPVKRDPDLCFLCGNFCDFLITNIYF